MTIKINLMPDKLVKKSVEKSRYPLYFLAISVFTAICVLSYSGIFIYKKISFDKRSEDAEKKKIELQEEISKNLASKDFLAVIATAVKGRTVGFMLSEHIYGSKICAFLEEVTLKNISYSKLSLEIADGGMANLKIAGEAENYRTLAKQLIIYKKTEKIKKIVFKEATGNKNGQVSFAVDLTFNLTPSKVSGLSAVSGNGQVSLSWAAPSDGGSPITNYKIYRGAFPDKEKILTVLENVTTYIDVNPAGGTDYYKVSAVNARGEGALSDEVKAAPSVFSPSAPISKPVPSSLPMPTLAPTPLQ